MIIEVLTGEEMYLFDTDAITNILKKQPSLKLIKKISSLKKEDQYISTITIGEIVYGAFKSKNAGFHLERLKTVLLPLVNILSFDSNCAYLYGKIRAELEKRGEIISSMDIQIASIAIANDLTLITGNIKHFARFSTLKVENWL